MKNWIYETVPKEYLKPSYYLAALILAVFQTVLLLFILLQVEKMPDIFYNGLGISEFSASVLVSLLITLRVFGLYFLLSIKNKKLSYKIAGWSFLIDSVAWLMISTIVFMFSGNLNVGVGGEILEISAGIFTSVMFAVYTMVCFWLYKKLQS